ncbi:hypothetical protein IE53DRAFT_366879 [Violaceomyces palustris]|uniref:Uncharacterized protein n=1 Tax=Violaceomyces palustris TaxID=1673888 RepID=A0ACD0P404_9BASI|nr:hypothetical protein IE53DRAFT_366879 [Violaceomyces palustris]
MDPISTQPSPALPSTTQQQQQQQQQQWIHGTIKKRPRTRDPHRPHHPASSSAVTRGILEQGERLPYYTSPSSSSWGAADVSDDSDLDTDYGGDGYDQDYRRERSTSSTSSRSILANAALEEDGGSSSLLLPPPSKRLHLEDPLTEREVGGRFAKLVLTGSSENGQLGLTGKGVSGSREAKRDASVAFGLSMSPEEQQQRQRHQGQALQKSNLPATPPAPPSSPTKAHPRDEVNLSEVEVEEMGGVGGDDLHLRGNPGNLASSSSSPLVGVGEGLLDIEEDVEVGRKKGPSSFEIEPNRIIINHLEDDEDDDSSWETWSAEVDGGGGGDRTGAWRSGGTEYVVNKELIDKLEAHRRYLLTGQDSDGGGGGGCNDPKQGGGTRGRRISGTRRVSPSHHFPLPSGGYGSRRRSSGESSPASSSGYNTPKPSSSSSSASQGGALILWKDPDQVKKAIITTPGGSTVQPHPSNPLSTTMVQEQVRRPILASGNHEPILSSTPVEGASSALDIPTRIQTEPSLSDLLQLQQQRDPHFVRSPPPPPFASPWPGYRPSEGQRWDDPLKAPTTPAQAAFDDRGGDEMDLD